MRKGSIIAVESYLKDSAFTTAKGMQSSKQGMPLGNRGYTIAAVRELSPLSLRENTLPIEGRGEWRGGGGERAAEIKSS